MYLLLVLSNRLKNNRLIDGIVCPLPTDDRPIIESKTNYMIFIKKGY